MVRLGDDVLKRSCRLVEECAIEQLGFVRAPADGYGEVAGQHDRRDPRRAVHRRP